MKRSGDRAALLPRKSNAQLRAELTVRFRRGDHAAVNDLAPADYRGREGVVAAIGPGPSDVRMEFDDGDSPESGKLKSQWLVRV